MFNVLRRILPQRSLLPAFFRDSQKAGQILHILCVNLRRIILHVGCHSSSTTLEMFDLCPSHELCDGCISYYFIHQQEFLVRKICMPIECELECYCRKVEFLLSVLKGVICSCYLNLFLIFDIWIHDFHFTHESVHFAFAHN